MSWPIKMHDFRPDEPAIGDAWPCPAKLEFDRDHPHENRDGTKISRLSPKYHREFAAQRPPIIVQLPSGPFCIDDRFFDYSKGGYYGDGWTVTGTLPAVTLSPSINVVGHYHGYIAAGVIGDDVDGRKF